MVSLSTNYSRIAEAPQGRRQPKTDDLSRSITDTPVGQQSSSSLASRLSRVPSASFVLAYWNLSLIHI